MQGFSHETIERVILLEQRARTKPGCSLLVWQVVLDVTDEESRKSVINKVLRECGCIDILVNNAGVLCPGKPASSTVSFLDRVKWNVGCTPRCSQLTVGEREEQVTKVTWFTWSDIEKTRRAMGRRYRSIGHYTGR